MISNMFERTVDKPIDPHIFRTVGPVTHSRPRLAEFVKSNETVLIS